MEEEEGRVKEEEVRVGGRRRRRGEVGRVEEEGRVESPLHSLPLHSLPPPSPHFTPFP